MRLGWFQYNIVATITIGLLILQAVSRLIVKYSLHEVLHAMVTPHNEPIFKGCIIISSILKYTKQIYGDFIKHPGLSLGMSADFRCFLHNSNNSSLHCIINTFKAWKKYTKIRKHNEIAHYKFCVNHPQDASSREPTLVSEHEIWQNWPVTHRIFRAVGPDSFLGW